MTYRTQRRSIRLTRAAGSSIVASLCLSIGALAQTAPKVETVVTLRQEPNGQTENITEGPDGAMYITTPFDRILWRVKDGKADKFFAAPMYAAISGVDWDKNELVVSALDHLPVQPRALAPAGQPSGGQAQGDQERAEGGLVFNTDIGPHSLILDKSGKVKATVSGENSSFFNGLARAGDHWFLITDTARGGVISLDTKAKTLTPWLQDPQMRPNGIKVHKGWVYLASADKVFRVEIGPDRKPKGGAVMFAAGAPGATDDFGIGPDGTLYIPSGKTMVKVSPSGERSVFLEDIETTKSPAAYVTKDGKWLYWIEHAGPAKVKRVALK